MAIREILISLGSEVNDGQIGKVKDALKNVKGLAVAAGAALAAVAAGKALFELTDQVAALGDEIAKTSKALGFNAEALQELRFVAAGAGVQNEQLTDGLKDLSKNSFEAANGNENFAKMFKRLGVSVRDVNGDLKPATALFGELSDGFKDLEDPTERVALAQTLLGGSGLKLIPLLEQGSEAIDKQRQRARELGEVYDQDLLKASEDFVDAQREVFGATQGLRNAIATQLLPIFTPLLQKFTEFMVLVRDPLVRGLKVVIFVFKTLFSVISTVIEGWTLLINLLPRVERNILLITAAVGLLVAILGLPVVLILAISAAIFLLIDDFITMQEGGESVIGTLIDGFRDLILEFGSVSEAIAEVFGTALEFWIEIMAELTGLSSEAANEVGAAFKESWDATIGFMANAFSSFIDEQLATAKKLFDFFGLTGDDATSVAAGRIGRTGSAAPGLGGGTVQPVGGGSNSQSVQNNLEVKVDASGTSNPQEVADMVSKRVNAVLEQQTRQAQQSFMVQMVSP